MAKKKVVTTKSSGSDKKSKSTSKQRVGTKTVKVKSTGDRKSSKVKPTQSRLKSSSKKVKELTFNQENYKWIGIGFGVIILGLLLMIGGSMPSPEVWDENIIYSFRRITLSPLVIVSGLAIVVYGIFK